MTNLYLRECALCHKVLGDDDNIITTLDFFAPTDLLSEYANVAMHMQCFMAWSKRDDFLLPRDVIREHKRTPDGLEIIRLFRKRNQVIIPQPEPDAA